MRNWFIAEVAKKSTVARIGKWKGRIHALLMLSAMVIGTFLPPVSAYALQHQINDLNLHGTTNTSTITPGHAGGLPSSLGAPVQPQFKPAANASGLQTLGLAAKGVLTDSGGAPTSSTFETPEKRSVRLKQEQAKKTAKEDVGKRTITSDTYQNPDGSFTMRQYAKPRYYPVAGNSTLQPIDTSLQTDTIHAATDLTALKSATGTPAAPATAYFKVTQNLWQAYFAPIGVSGHDAVTLAVGNQTVGITPKISGGVIYPVLSTDSSGHQSITYKNVWQGTDVVYQVQSDELKENVVVHSATAATSYAFAITGASLVSNSDGSGGFSLKGNLAQDFAVAPTVVSAWEAGPVSKQVTSTSFKNGVLTTTLDKAWLKSLPANNFPVAIDPTFNSSFGTRTSGNYQSFKSDGYNCTNSYVCLFQAGGLYDSNQWKFWHGMFYAPYSQLQGHTLLGANLHMSMLPQSAMSGWAGVTNNLTMYVSYASCSGYNCYQNSSPISTGTIGSAGDVNIYSTIKWMQDNNIWGGWLFDWMQEGAYNSYKVFDPDNSYITINYNTAPPQTSVVTPVNNGVVVTNQPSMRVNTVSDAEGQHLQYYFRLASGTDAESGSLAESGWQDAPEWTVPDGVLQDGQTYYWHVYTSDGYEVTGPNWVSAFKVDLRTGNDPTQTMDSDGSVAVNLATGNLTTTAATHSIQALGGAIGLGLTYNSPVRSHQGLVAKYWNNTNQSGAAALTRTDQNVDFNWDSGSPSTGTVNADNFSAEWSGYLVAPQTGDYYFGGNHDDYFHVIVNNQDMYNFAGDCGGPCFGTSSIHLTAGQVVPIDVKYTELGGLASTQLWARGPMGDTVVPATWLQTGVQPVAITHGLTGSYYRDDGSHNFVSSAKPFLVRTDPAVNFNWGTSSPVPSGPVDNFLVRWSGYLTVPTSGTYQFGAASDDGIRITVGNTTTPIYSSWQDNPGTESFGGSVALTQGQAVPITVEYFEHGGSAAVNLEVQGAVAKQTIPAAWLTPKAQIVPDGWQLTTNADAKLSYDHLYATDTNVVLTDSSGAKHTYAWTGSGYTPPSGEDGRLTKNGDGTYNLQDVDGRTYVFGTDGTLTATSIPVDDKKPANLTYSYSSAPAHITKITDGVTSARYGTVYYSGDSACPTAVPTGFDAAAPSGMVCAFQTSDGQTTQLWYKSGLLARMVSPGSAAVDWRYDTLGRIVQVRSLAANDAIAAGIRAEDDSTTSQIAYDAVGRATTITSPAANTGDTRGVQTISYLPGNGSYAGATETHVTGQSEPNGFTKHIEYDSLFRTTKATDTTNLNVTTTWDPNKDLATSTTDPLGMKSTSLFDNNDRVTDTYGPAPSAWYNTNGTPQSTYTSQVPHTSTSYDQNIAGLEATYYDYGASSKSLMGVPRLHTQGIGTSNGDVLHTWSATPPVTLNPNYNGWGVRLTGEITLNEVGTHTFRLYSDDGVRLSIDDTTVINDWTDGAARSHPTGTFYNATAGKTYRIQLDYYDAGGNDATLQLFKTAPGGSETSALGSMLKPKYSLVTTATTYDATAGNMVTTTNYGSSPQLGLAQSQTVDPSGLNLTTSHTYETASTGFNRQTSTTLPGGGTTTMGYWGATDTADNPCTTAVESYSQAGFQRYTTTADPDGSGPQTGRVAETIYDNAGRAVAMRYNQDNWTCNTYDSRGRPTQTVTPAYNGNAARTVNTNYAVSSNPLASSTTDASGSIVITNDLLGRIATYTDVFGDTTTYHYDSMGNVTEEAGPIEDKTYTYDQFNRLVTESLDGTVLAHVYYDAYNQINHVAYPDAGSLSLTNISRDSLSRVNGYTYGLTGGTSVTDQVNLSQAGLVTNDIVSSGAQSLWYTYGYDHADRLTSANIGPHTYAYGYGNESASCAAGTNVAAGGDGNRTSQTIDGVSTTYCYNNADRLVSSSDPTANYAEYDSHGNMTYLGTGNTPLRLCYDSSDRNMCLVNYDGSGNGNAMYYNRDAAGRITYREHDNVSGWNWYLGEASWYDYSGPASAPAYVRDANWDVVEKFVSLPGGVLLSIQPNASPASAQKTYSLPNIHGDTLLTANGLGNNTSTGNGPASSFTYDPFGNVLAGSTHPINTDTTNSFGWAGTHALASETLLGLGPILLGARVYLPTLGRFTAMDPVEGGAPNAYAYLLDPINSSDYTGASFWGNVLGVGEFIAGTAAFVSSPFLGPEMDALGVVLYGGAAYQLTGSQQAAINIMAGAGGMGALRGGGGYSGESGNVGSGLQGGSGAVSSTYKSSLSTGQAAHTQFSRMVQDANGLANRAVFDNSRLRPDGYFPESNTILELKPANFRGVQTGTDQLQGYLNVAPPGANTELWLYNQNADGSFNIFLAPN